MNQFKEASKPAIHGHESKYRGKSAKPSPPLLFHADANDPDMLYFSRFQAIDPYPAFSVNGGRFAVTHEMEYGRMVKESAFDEILLLNEVREGAAKRFNPAKGRIPDQHESILHLADLHGIHNFRGGARVPIGLGRKLSDAGMILDIADDEGLFPEQHIPPFYPNFQST